MTTAPEHGGGGPYGRATTPAGPATLADIVAAPPAVPDWRQAFSAGTFVKIAVLTGLMLVLHLRQLDFLVRKWADPNWMHGYIIPLFSLYLVYSRRELLFAARRRVCWAGLPLVLFFLVGQLLWIYPGRNYWFSQLCMIAMLLSLVLYLAGPQVVRAMWLPILYLLFAMPLPDAMYQAISLPLQNIAAKGAVGILHLGLSSIRSSASSITLVSQSGVERHLTVAEACSGIRLLMAFVALGVAMAYLDERPIWQRVILVLAAVPIAIFCNVLRVSITCFMFYIDKEELGQSFMHTFTGLLMLIPAFLLLWALGWLLRNIFVEDDESEARAEGVA